MATTTAAPTTPSPLRTGEVVRGTLVRRPDAWVYAVALAAAAVLFVAGALYSGSPDGEVSRLAAWGGWMLMVLAMMLPVVAPQAQRIAMTSLWRRRHRAMIGYLAGYLAVWAVAGVAIVGALDAVGQAHAPASATVVALLGAALWQPSRPRRRVMRRCASLRTGAPKGLAADRDCAAAGWRSGLLCATTCGPVMLAMTVGHHSPALMAGLFVLLLTERARGPNPERRAGRPLEAWCLVGYAALVAVAAVS